MKLNLSQTQGFSSHRAGWSYCLDSLRPFHSNAGLFVSDFIERQFSWELIQYYNYKNKNNLPYQFPWIGFLHNPHNMPDWFDRFHSPQAIFGRPVFQEALRKCRALIVLSDYLADWVKLQTDVPVISLKYPSPPAKQWNKYTFLRQEIKTVAQVGYWLRRIESIAKLKVPVNYKKAWLPSNTEHSKYLVKRGRKSTELSGVESDHRWASVKTLEFMDNDKYDDLYSTSVIFLDLYDSSANTAIVEAISRNTPVVVNRHPAVEEYLGKDYPLYYDSLDDVYQILLDSENIIHGHQYLCDMKKDWLTGRYFATDLMNKLKGVL